MTAEEIIKEKDFEILSVTSETTVFDTVAFMVEHKIGAVLIKDGNKFKGIWSERDLMRNIIKEGFDPKTAIVSDYMTKDLHSISHDATITKMYDRFLGLHIRHLLIKKEGEYIGLLSTGDVVRASLIDKENYCKELKSMVSWEYYENWKDGPKRARVFKKN